jgi:hypothetical protein
MRVVVIAMFFESNARVYSEPTARELALVIVSNADDQGVSESLHLREFLTFSIEFRRLGDLLGFE